MTEQQETFENTVTENVDNIRYVVETETAPPIIEEASGAEITLDDSAYRQVRGLNLYGYSKQTQTTGAQLLDYSTLPGAQNGITPSIDNDNYIVLNGTATANAFIYVLCNIPSGTNMFISVNNPVLNSNISVYIRDEKSTYSSEYIALDTANKTHAFASVSVAISRFVIRVVQGTKLTNFRLRPMLNSGTSALPWEPYSGGVASPSPDWAQPIRSVADDTNLLDESLFTQTGTAFRFIHIQTDAESVTVSSNTPRASAGSAYIQAIPGNVSSMEGITTSANGVYAGQSRTISPSDGYITIGYFLNGIGSENINFSDYWVMVNAGDTALPYRPYGHNTMVASAGANLIETIDGQTNNGISATLDDDGYIVLNGTATSDVFLASNCYVDAETQVFLSAGNPTGNSAIQLYFLYNASEVAFSVSLSAPNVTAFTATQSRAWTRFNLKILKGTSLTNYRLRPMLNRGSTPLPWQPCVAPSSALIALTDSLRGIPVTSGGNYTDESGQQWIADYIYRRQADRKWMIWRNCIEVLIDGSVTWGYNKQTDTLIQFVSWSTIINHLPSLFSNIISEIGVGGELTEGAWIYAGRALVLCLKKILLSQETTEGVRQWCEENPFHVVYRLATPTVEELPENVQTELNGLYTYNLHTDMWNNDGAYMNLKYVADTKTWINNKIAGISTAMLSQN